jgi:hypothetical protein
MAGKRKIKAPKAKHDDLAKSSKWRLQHGAFALGRADYHQQFEAMLYGWKAGAQHDWCGARDLGNVWHFDKPARNDLHPTMKPVAPGRARDPQQQQAARHGAGLLRRFRHDDDRGGVHGAACRAAGRSTPPMPM